jgi:hypothetical protein
MRRGRVGVGQAVQQLTGDPQQFLLGPGELECHRAGQPGIALAHVPGQRLPPRLGNGQQ